MGYHLLNSLELLDRTTHVIFWFLTNGNTHVHCVCGGAESEYTSGQKDFILGPRLEGGGGGGDNKFSFLFKGIHQQKSQTQSTKLSYKCIKEPINLLKYLVFVNLLAFKQIFIRKLYRHFPKT